PALRVPESLFRCEALEVLQLKSGQIEHLSSGIGRLRRLRGLGLAHNQLTELPRELSELSELTHLDVSNNRLTDIGTVDFGRLPLLGSLDVSGNQLRRLAQSLERCPPSQFAVLAFHTNPIDTMPEWLTRQERLRSLDIRQTAIKEPPHGLRPDVVVYA
ncbi:MAG: leucine-rich repeat domain-containing protein, partial [Myxococcales bacterium]|nr:leucine-rich repeat domain-containing protein [Myxococcales bacterium]